MSNGLEFDEEASRRVEALYKTPDVVSYRCEVLQALEIRPGERVLDIGVGPGFLAYDLAVAAGSTGRVTGIDISEDMLSMSRGRCAETPWAEFRTADSTRLPFADGEFDAAVSTQVYEYVADLKTALAELHRVLRPGGRALILDTDWDSIVWHSSDPARMARVLKAWGEHLVDPHLPRTFGPIRPPAPGHPPHVQPRVQREHLQPRDHGPHRRLRPRTRGRHRGGGEGLNRGSSEEGGGGSLLLQPEPLHVRRRQAGVRGRGEASLPPAGDIRRGAPLKPEPRPPGPRRVP